MQHTDSLLQIFYPYKIFDTTEKINKLKPYMYQQETGKQQEKQIEKQIEKQQEKQIEKPENPPKPEEALDYYPDQKSSLFWSIYVSIYGMNEYTTLAKNKYSTIELRENQKIIDFFKDQPKTLKSSSMKLTNTDVQDILSDLMVGTKNKVSVLPAYSIYYKRNIIVYYKNENVYLEYTTELDHPFIYLCYDSKRNRFGIQFSFLRETAFRLESDKKALKPISSYKVKDLETIASQLKIETGKHKKPELYSLLEIKLSVSIKFPLKLTTKK